MAQALYLLKVGLSFSSAFASSLTFDAFEVPLTLEKPVSRIKLTTTEAKRFRTVIEREARLAANFAGHFRMVNLGCGASCIYPAILNLNIGTVVIPGFYVVLASVKSLDAPLDYRQNSRLVIVNGDFNETGKEVGTYYFEWDGNLLKPLRFVARKRLSFLLRKTARLKKRRSKLCSSVRLGLTQKSNPGGPHQYCGTKRVQAPHTKAKNVNPSRSGVGENGKN